MSKPPANIRSDIWRIAPTDDQAKSLRLTVDEYRKYLRPLVLITYWNWSDLSNLDSKEAGKAIEKLFHKTKKNSSPKYGFYFDKAIANNPSFRKFPSYLSRAAIAEAIGIVSSFVTRWNKWKNYDRKHKYDKPPKLTAFCNSYPVMYQGDQLKWFHNYQHVDIKVWNGSDWVWTFYIPIKSHGMGRVFLDSYDIKSASLICNKKGIHLSVPFKFKTDYAKKDQLVAATDIGINKTAVTSIVDRYGTVIARRFFHLGRDIDRRDRRRMTIKRKAKRTVAIQKAQSFGDKLPKKFCAGLYRKSSNINEHIAQTISTKIVEFAKEFNATVLVFEDLKNWKAKAGKRKSLTKQRFHSWCKDRLVELAKQKAQENSIRVKTINAKYTSKYAYDGSGIVKRSPKNYALATFKTGKKYDCDLSASYNIAARYWYSVIVGDKFFTRVYQAEVPDSSRRIPVTLSSLWELAALANSTVNSQSVL